MRKSKNEETGRLKAALARAGKNIRAAEQFAYGEGRYKGVSCRMGKLHFETDEAFGKWVRSLFDLSVELPGNDLLQSVFSIAGLDYEDPFHWKTILLEFCKHHFGKAKTKPSKSLGERYCIYIDYIGIKEKNPNLTEEQICKQMIRHMPAYKNYGTDSLRKIVRQARSPERNVALKYPDTPNVAAAISRLTLEKMGMPWTEEQKAATVKVLQYLLENWDAASGEESSDANE